MSLQAQLGTYGSFTATVIESADLSKQSLTYTGYLGHEGPLPTIVLNATQEIAADCNKTHQITLFR